MLHRLAREKKLEIAFLSLFSLFIVGIFYALISMNGLVLGNDPAVHLKKAQIFLETGQISLGNTGWIPPLFEILLATAISLTGTVNIGQMIFIEKALAVAVDWLLFLSVYFLASKVFNRKIGAVAAVFLSMCYPIYFLNTWGGYTTALGMTFLLLLFYLSYLAPKKYSYLVITFFVAFGVVLSHQLTAFITVVTLLPFMFLMAIKFKGAYLKVLVTVIVGGTVAFFAFYYSAFANYLDIAIYHMFFGNKAYLTNIPYTNFQAFLQDFGFILFLAMGGIGVSYYLLKRQRKLTVFTMLIISIFVPFFFAESYLFGLLLPFEWFMYYLAPIISIFAAVCIVFAMEKLSVHLKNGHGSHKKWLKITTIGLILVACCPIIGFQVYNVHGEVMYDANFNSITDMNAYDAAVWLNQNYPDARTIVSSMSPGDWFSVYTGKQVISQTYDWEGRNEIAEPILDLAYEIQGSQTLLKTYEPVDCATYENYVLIDQLWNRVTYSSINEEYITFNQDGVNYHFCLSNLSRTISCDPGKQNVVEFKYFNNQVTLTQKIIVQNSSYPIDISWSLSPRNSGISNITLYLTTHFDRKFDFERAKIPPFMDWVNPWDTSLKFTNGQDWASVDFLGSDMDGHYIGLYDQERQTAFAFNFTDLPDRLNIGAVASHQIDALRYQYDVKEIGVDQTVTRQYQELTLSKSSYAALQPEQLQILLSSNFTPITLWTNSYKERISENNVDFIIYDRTQFDLHTSLPLGSSFLPKLNQCQFLEMVYSNSRYAIFKVTDNYNQTQVWNN